jgi:hypothetical protein
LKDGRGGAMVRDDALVDLTETTSASNGDAELKKTLFA